MPIRSLGYIRWRTSQLAEWTAFATDILGLMATGSGEDALAMFRIDDRPYRFSVVAGEEAGIDALGFEVGDEEELADVCRDLESWGGKTLLADPGEAERRRVSGLAHWIDPSGIPVELYYGSILTHEPLVTPLVSGFVTGEMGMGHVVIGTGSAADALHVYRDVLHFHCRNTMQIRMAPDAPRLPMWFLGCNPRHHTLGLIGMEWPRTLAHFMLEAASIDDVGRAHDRCVDAGVPIAMSLGKHTNDHMISFYCVAPDGVQVELGYGGLRVEGPQVPPIYEITKVSFWGHRAPA